MVKLESRIEEKTKFGLYAQFLFQQYEMYILDIFLNPLARQKLVNPCIKGRQENLVVISLIHSAQYTEHILLFSSYFSVPLETMCKKCTIIAHCKKKSKTF